MTAVEEVLADIRAIASDEHDKGDRFERLMLHAFQTDRTFLGTLFGDHAKTAIGTMLSTGTVVGAGANVFGAGAVPKYVAPFSWGHAGSEVLTEEGFLRIAERVLPRALG